MDVLAVKQAVEFAKNWTQSGKGPLLLEMVTYRYGGHSMSDPGTTYRTREEIQHMRSSNDPITGLKTNILEWGVVEEAELKQIDKQARSEVEQAVEEAKKSPEPAQDKDMWTDIYYKGTNPMYMRGREREEVSARDKAGKGSTCRPREVTDETGTSARRFTTLLNQTLICTRTAPNNSAHLEVLRN